MRSHGGFIKILVCEWWTYAVFLWLFFLLMSFFFFYMEAFSIKKKFWVYFYTGLVVGSVHVQESHFGIRSV